MVRIYQDLPLVSKQEIALDKEASHHIARVLRMQVGESLIIFDGKNKQYAAEIVNISKQTVTVLLGQEVAGKVESPIELCLVQGIAKGEKMDWIVQKAVELGVTAIYPLQTERGNVRLSAEREDKRIAHWQKVIISACEQSGRVKVPTLHPILSLSEYLTMITVDETVFVLSPHVQGALSKANSNRYSILIGPEGGLSEQEIAQALAAGCKPLNLGPRILRTETAAVTALSIIQFSFGDLS